MADGLRATQPVRRSVPIHREKPFGHSKFLAELNELDQDEWPTRLRRLVSEQVGLILRRTVDADRPLSEYGLDSLGNLELRTRIEAETGFRITATDINTMRGLADYLFEKHWRPRRRTPESDVNGFYAKVDRNSLSR